MLDGQNMSHLLNYSGCGNTTNANHPAVKDLIMESCRRYAHVLTCWLDANVLPTLSMTWTIKLSALVSRISLKGLPMLMSIERRMYSKQGSVSKVLLEWPLHSPLNAVLVMAEEVGYCPLTRAATSNPLRTY